MVKTRKRRLGFTGTQTGMTQAQEHTISALVQKLKPLEAGHGDCVGADKEFHTICRVFNCFNKQPFIRTIGFIPDNNSKRAFCEFDFVRDPKPYLVRNKDIVNWCRLLLAAPKGEEELRSGTWSTIRYARKIGRSVWIIDPHGRVAKY